MKKLSVRFAGVAMGLLLLGAVSQMWAQEPQQVRLGVRRNKVINGIEAQLRGDYRADGAPTSLNSQLENINIPVGTPIAFCLVQNGVATRLGVGKVAVVGGIQVATVELATRDGDIVPTVNAGNVLQARQSATPPFRTNPGCGAPLLISGLFN